MRYRGDPLTRPIASFEVGFLVRLLVALSLRLNAWLALDRPWTPEEDPPENKAQVGSCSGVFFNLALHCARERMLGSCAADALLHVWWQAGTVTW